MKIRSLQLKNIGVFEDETIAFPEKKVEGAEIHILTGQNGTGKTTVLQLLARAMSYSEPFDSDNWYNLKGRNKNKFESILDKKFFAPYDSKAFIKFENINSEIAIIKTASNLGMERRGMPFYKQIEDKSFEENKIIYNEYRKDIGIAFSFFAYSGYRFIENEENINIKEKENYNPLKNALEFNKTYDKDDYSLNQWLANTISKRSFARDEGNDEKANLINRNIKSLEQIIEQIIEKPIKFEPVYETGIKIIANIEGKKLDFDLLPDGLRSIISWLGDLIMRMDALKWKDDLDIKDREFLLFLDEIEVHLHPYWQRKILPVVQKTFKNAQIFITTHSPFIVNSIDGAWVHRLKFVENTVKVEKATLSENGDSIGYVLKDVFGIDEEFGPKVNKDLKEFYELRDKILANNLNGSEQRFIDLSKNLANQSLELNTIIQFELRQLNKILNTNYTL